MNALPPYLQCDVVCCTEVSINFLCVFPEQTQLAEMEHSHSLCESLVQQRDEVQREAERMRSSLRDVERTLGTRERAHRHRVKGLEEQVPVV